MYINALRHCKFAFLATMALLLCVGVTAVQPAAAQSNGEEPDQQEIAVHYSLYYEDFKNENYEGALPNLHWILKNAPTFPANRDDDLNYERLIDAYKGIAEKSEDEARKKAFVDSTIYAYDLLINKLKEFGSEFDEFKYTRDKGRYIQTNAALIPERQDEAVEAYLKTYELDPTRVDPYYLDVILRDRVQKGDIGGALDFLNEIRETRGEEEKVNELVNNYFALIPPEQQMEFLEEQLEAEPGNLETMKKLLDVYEILGEKEKALAMVEELMQKEPTEALLRTALRAYNAADQTNKAKEVFAKLEAMGAEFTADDYFNRGIAEQKQGNLASALSFYRKALDVDPGYSRAAQTIPHLYATAASKCGVSEREDQAIFWIVSDIYRRAGMTADANKYAQYFPTAEDIFYVKQWTEGGTITVSRTCMGLNLSGTTTVRRRQ